jgi:predicted metal-binding protein
MAEVDEAMPRNVLVVCRDCDTEAKDDYDRNSIEEGESRILSRITLITASAIVHDTYMHKSSSPDSSGETSCLLSKCFS